MRVVPFSAEAEAVLRRCEEALVVVDFVRLAADEPNERGELAHRRAAVTAVAEACQRGAEEMEAYIAGDPPHLREIGENTARRLRAEAERVHKIDPTSLHGQRVSNTEFYGSGYAGRALVPDLNEHYAMLDDLDFTRAFCLPPYGLVSQSEGRGWHALSQSDVGELFESVVNEVLRSPDSTTEIWKWSTDWSTYFDAGREWWGTACWTLATGDDAIVAVLASSTD
jgi:hypothetical protein